VRRFTTSPTRTCAHLRVITPFTVYASTPSPRPLPGAISHLFFRPALPPLEVKVVINYSITTTSILDYELGWAGRAHTRTHARDPTAYPHYRRVMPTRSPSSDQPRL